MSSVLDSHPKFTDNVVPPNLVPHFTFDSVDQVLKGLESVSYLADEQIATVVYLAGQLAKPILVEGPAGTGKTELAKAVAAFSSSRLIRLQCYEGLDESKALYEWNYRKQLLCIQAQETSQEGLAWSKLEADIFSSDFLLTRPLLDAISATDPVVLLIDEVDRVEMETEALFLEALSDWQVSVPELGTISANRIPFALLTSNATRELSEALKRRCLYLYLDYPSLEREREILRKKVEGIDDYLANQVAKMVRLIRSFDLKKLPSISETLDWARTLLLLGIGSLDLEGTKDTLHILLKYASDIDKVVKELDKLDTTDVGDL